MPGGWSGNTTGINTSITPSGTNGGELILEAKAFGLVSKPCSAKIKLEVASPTTAVVGNPFLCVGAPEKYTLTELNILPPSSIVTWEVTPSNAVKVSVGSGTSATLNSTGLFNGDATITFKISNNCGQTTRKMSFFMGEPVKPEIKGPDCFPSGATVNLFVNSPGATGYTWGLPQCNQPYNDPVNDPFPVDCWVNMQPKNIISSQTTVYVGKTGGYISVFASNVCGVTSSLLRVNYCEEGDGPFTGPFFPLIWNGGNYGNVYPNPVEGDLTIELDKEDFDFDTPKNIYITGIEGGEKQTLESFNGNNTILDLSYLPSGSYILFIEAKERTVFSKFIKK